MPQIGHLRRRGCREIGVCEDRHAVFPGVSGVGMPRTDHSDMLFFRNTSPCPVSSVVIR